MSLNHIYVVVRAQHGPCPHLDTQSGIHRPSCTSRYFFLLKQTGAQPTSQCASHCTSSVLVFVTDHCRMAWHGMAWHGMAWHDAFSTSPTKHTSAQCHGVMQSGNHNDNNQTCNSNFKSDDNNNTDSNNTDWPLWSLLCVY